MTDDQTSEEMVSLGAILDATRHSKPKYMGTGDAATPLFVHEAERMFLGAMFLEPDEVMLKAEDVGLIAEDFHNEKHKLIFHAAYGLWQDKTGVDTISVADELQRSDRLNMVGGARYLCELESLLPTAAVAHQHARLIQEKSLLRSLYSVCGEAQHKAKLGESPFDVIDFVQNRCSSIARVGGTSTFVDMHATVKKAVESMPIMGGEDRGTPTGFFEVDRLIKLRPGEFIIVAGRPSMGKTQFALDLVKNKCLKENKRVAFFSLEMPADRLADRIIASASGVDVSRFRTPESNINRVTHCAGLLADSGLMIDDTSVRTSGEIRSIVRREHNRRPLDLVVIDYLQLMSTPGGFENRTQAVGDISKGLKQLARELEIPVIALSQLNRGVEARADKRPMMSDLRESGNLEQDADIITFLFRPEYYMRRGEVPPEYEGRAELIVAKHRNGPTGTAVLRWRNEPPRFENMARED